MSDQDQRNLEKKVFIIKSIEPKIWIQNMAWIHYSREHFLSVGHKKARTFLYAGFTFVGKCQQICVNFTVKYFSLIIEGQQTAEWYSNLILPET